MKKLMIALAAVAVAAVTQASSINWSASNIKKGTSAASGIAYLFTADTYTRTTIGAALQEAYANDGLDTFIETYAVASTSVSAGAFAGNTDEADFITDPGKGTAAAAKHFWYAVVFDADSFENIGDSTSFFVTKNNGTTKKAVPTSGGLTLGFGDLSSASTADGAWTAMSVPEPTSGLLMLLGMAGLALRRRRA